MVPRSRLAVMLIRLFLEWSAGYGPRYGIMHVDFETLKRTPKNSAYYLRDTMKDRRKATGNV